MLEFKSIKDFNFVKEIHIGLLTNPKAPSQFINEPDYQILILRLLDVGSSELVDTSYSYVVYKEKYYLIERGEEVFPLKDGFDGFYQSLDENFNYIYQILNSFVEEVEGLEDDLYERSISRYFMDIWFQFRRDILKLEKFIYRSRLYLEDFSAVNKTLVQNYSTQFADLHHKLTVNIRLAKWYLSKLDTLYHYYGSIKNEKLNKNIYFLAIVSAVFLPLNLIVGFFGMNTKNLFFESHPNGTTEVLYILVVVFIILLFGLPLMKAVDQYVLSFFLGRYNFYKKLSNRIDQISKELEIR